jgi:NAD(P)-dependent dehydrogenase (short-subunit alcohol dehydrogenase family)
MNLTGKRVLITGGSSGIGFALAEQMCAKGAAVMLTGRREEIVMTPLRDCGLRASGLKVRLLMSPPRRGAR